MTPQRSQSLIIVGAVTLLVLKAGLLTKMSGIAKAAFGFQNAGTAQCPQGATFDLPSSGQCPTGYQIQTNFDGRKFCICTAGLNNPTPGG